jgi:hypothetical protein
LPLGGEHRNAGQPWAERLGVAQAVNGLERLNKRVVDGVLELGIRAKKTEEHATHLRRETSMKVRRRTRVTVAQGLDQLIVIALERQRAQHAGTFEPLRRELLAGLSLRHLGTLDSHN